MTTLCCWAMHACACWTRPWADATQPTEGMPYLDGGQGCGLLGKYKWRCVLRMLLADKMAQTRAPDVNHANNCHMALPGQLGICFLDGGAADRGSLGTHTAVQQGHAKVSIGHAHD